MITPDARARQGQNRASYPSSSLPGDNQKSQVMGQATTNRPKKPPAFLDNGQDWQDFVCGGSAACVNIVFTYPMFKLMLRQQVDGVRAVRAFGQLRKEGITNLYRGVLPPLIQKGASMSIMFGFYHKFQRILLSRYPEKNQVFLQVCSGFMAGTLEAGLSPFERVQTLLSDHKHHEKIANTVHAFRKIWKHHSFKEYYRGLSAIILRNGPSSALFFSLRGPIKDSMPGQNLLSSTEVEALSFVEDFISGSLLGAALSTLFYPLNVVKSNMQRHLGGPHHGIVRTFASIYAKRGYSLRKMYFGVGVNFSRALVSWGMINATYEMFRKLLVHQESYEHVF
eukprot:gene11841-13071_t